MLLRLLPFLLILPLSLPLAASESSTPRLAAELLRLAGTAAVVEERGVRAALADPAPFAGEPGRPRRERLLADAGLKPWRGPRVWLLQSQREGEAERWRNLAASLGEAALARGYQLVDAAPLPAAEQALALLSPGVVPPRLDSLLSAYEAEVLVLVRGSDWSMWMPDIALQGRLAPHQVPLLPQVLAEALAGLQQWPEAPGQTIVEVAGVADLAGHAGAQQALQALPGVRQARLIRVGKGRAWYAVGQPARDPLAVLLDGEPRLRAARAAGAAQLLPPGAAEARQVASPLLRREWVPEAGGPAPAAGR